MDKFGRNYSLNIQASSGELINVTPPFTIEFDITRNTLTSANVCQVKIYNLGLIRRNQIRRNINDYGPPFQGVQLLAGYGDNLTEVFNGNITQAYSVRQGQDYITTIECFDGGFAFNNAKTDRSFAAGTPQKAIFASMFGDLPYVKPGVIGNYTGALLRGNTYSGNTVNILRELTGGGFFIDGGKAHCLGDAEYIDDGDTLTVNAATGLLSTPVLERTIARFDMLFEPSLNIGTKVIVNSLTEKNFNGSYKVIEVKHRGMISDAVAGNVVTSGGFFFTKLLTGIRI